MNNMNIYKLKTECDYFCKYYGSEFIPGLGTEQILEYFNKYFGKSKWLDIGGGSSSLLWWLAQRHKNKVCIVDVSREAFLLTKILKNSHFDQGCFDCVKKKYKSKDIGKCNVKFKYYDFFNHPVCKLGKYKNVSQIGLLGLCKDKKMFLENFYKLISIVAKNGVLICANWIFNDVYALKKGFKNDYITKNFLKNLIVKDHELSLKELKYIKFNNNESYKGVVIYVIQKKKKRLSNNH